MQQGKKLWQKVARDLKRAISQGKWPVNSIIPSEIELAELHQVSRDTMRKALKALVDQGLLERTPHVGTRVISRNRAQAFRHELSSLHALDAYGGSYPRRIQNASVVTLDAAQGAALGYPAGTRKFRFENIRVDTGNLDEPMVVTYVYIDPAPIARKVFEEARSRPYELIVSLVEEVCSVECAEVRQTLSGTAMPEQAAAYFKVPVGSPALRIVRDYLNSRGETLVITESYHPGDRFSFSFSAKKKPVRRRA